jgi:hypothetical protein
MLGLAAPAALVAPIVAKEVERHEMQVGYGSHIPGMPLSRGRLDVIDIRNWSAVPMSGGVAVFDRAGDVGRSSYIQQMKMPRGY